MTRKEARNKIEQLWWEIDCKTASARKMMPTPKQHINLWGDKQKYLEAVLSLFVP